ncbi:LysM peptidoglycan-binding domain-containing protein [Candidatus Auribacterota bacterium]
MKKILVWSFVMFFCVSIVGCKTLSKKQEIVAEEEVTSPSIEYRVEKGDTLYKISRKFGLTVDEIVEENNIQDKNLIKVGTVLKIAK